MSGREKPDLSGFDQERVAVILRQGGNEYVFTGIARFEHDHKLGNILRIRNDSGQPADLLISEQDWDGQIVPDQQHGCRFCFIS